MKLTSNNILLREVKAELKTSSGIILTQDQNSGVKSTRVDAVGPDVTLVSPGDTIIGDYKDAMPVTIDNAMGIIISEDKIKVIL